MNRISIFHYHLLPGGVTNVILLETAALIRHYPDLRLMRLVCGREENTASLRRKIEKEIDATGLIADDLEFEICILPELDYRDFDEKISSGKIERLSAKLTESFGDSLWWVHNYQLGKNPLFTAALLRITEQRPEQRILFHIHDFPECARYENLQKLYDAGISNPYPVTENTAYACINGRDTEILKNAGIPADKVFLLNNPVEMDSETDDRPETEKQKQAFYAHYRDEFPGTDPEGRMLFYPVRTIRRKNALEAGLIAAISKQPVNLVLSLPGVSNQEKNYSDICEDCFRRGLIPGIWGSGTDTAPAVPSYPVMLDLADLIISTSVQEGFGYLFINSVMLGAPLFARDLDILDGIRSFFPEQRTCFYRTFKVPLTESEIGTLKKRYTEKLARIGSYISESASNGIKESISQIGADKTVDYSFLPAEKQVQILEQLGGSGSCADEIHSLNSELMNSFYKLLNAGRISAQADISAFSLKSHSNTIEKIVRSIYSDVNTDIHPATEVQRRLLDHFARPDYMRLIYDC